MELFYPAILCLLAAAIAAALVFRNSTQLSSADRLMRALIPIGAASVLVEAAVAVRSGPFWIWNDVRLARSVALVYGYKLYYDAHGGPIIGTMHAPLGYAVYAMLGWLRNPTVALLAGCTISALLIFGPMAWILLRPRSSQRVLVFVGCSLMAFFSSGLIYSAFRIHADAAALGFAAIAAGFLYRGDRVRTWQDLALSALFAALSVWSKQTLAPVVVALPAFVWMSEGFKQLCRYVACLAGAGAAVSVLAVAAFGPLHAMWFNLYVIPLREPHLPEKNVLRQIWLLGTENLLPAAIILFLLLQVFFAGDRTGKGFRQFLSTHRWLVFAFVAAAMIPTFLAGVLKVGGDVNHFSLISYFVLLCAGAALVDHLRAGSDTGRIFAIILVLIGLLRVPVALVTLIGTPALSTNPSQAAYNFEKAQPGIAYFPYNPLAVLLASGKLYHSDIGLKDRELSGFGVDKEQFEKYVPRDFRIVAIPPAPPASTTILRQELEGFTKTRGTGDLAGWTVYERP